MIFQDSPFAHTFSIVARDPESGQMGVAVQSHWFSVGSVVPWAQAGIGAIATQSLTEISYGPLGLDLLRGGKSARQALEALLVADENKEVRQVAMVDANDSVAVHTGARCIQAAGHVAGDGFSVQANMMLHPGVPEAMEAAYKASLENKSIDLAERLLLALEAAQAAGGDIRGMQSAAIKVVGKELSSKVWEGVVMELRVEDHPQPLVELRRVMNIHRAYTWMNQGDADLADNKPEAALASYQKAVALAPDIVEIPFWNAVTLCESGRVEEAMPVFQAVFEREPVWAELLRRLPAAGLFKEDADLMERILKTSSGINQHRAGRIIHSGLVRRLWVGLSGTLAGWRRFFSQKDRIDRRGGTARVSSAIAIC